MYTIEIFPSPSQIQSLPAAECIAQLQQTFVRITSFTAEEAIANYNTLCLVEELSTDSGVKAYTKQLRRAVFAQMVTLVSDEMNDCPRDSVLAPLFSSVTGIRSQGFFTPEGFFK
jgi:c-di-GMP-related signal transduction protein